MRRFQGRVRMLAALLAVFALVAGACGDDGGGGSGSGDDGGGNEAAPTQAQASAALLTTADLPSGWQGGPAEDDGEEDSSEEFCDDFQTEDEVEPAAEAEAEFAAAETGPFVLHAVALYRDEDEASRVMDLVDDALDSCKEFTDTDEDLGELTGSFTKTSPDDIGDEAVGATLSAKGTGLDMAGELLVVRQGRGVSMLMQFGVQVQGMGGSELQEDLTEQLGAKAVAKLEAAA